MRIIWETPPDIRQRSSDTCWAAVLEAFCRVSPGRPQLSQDELLREYGSLSNSSLDRKIPLDGIRRLFAEHRFGIEIEEVSHTYFAKTPASWCTNCRTVRYYRLLGTATNGWHLSLVYGIENNVVSYLNPDMEGGGHLKNEIAIYR